jgi:hypothetical protein
MDKLVGVLVLAMFAIGIAIYVVRSYAKMTPKGTAKHFGLEPDERVAQMWVGEADGVAHIAFASPYEVSIRHTGAGNRSVQGGPSARFELAGRDGIPLRVLLHDSAVAYLAGWQAGAARPG